MPRKPRTVIAHTKGGVPVNLRLSSMTTTTEQVILPHRDNPLTIGYLTRPVYTSGPWRSQIAHMDAQVTAEHPTRAEALTHLHTQHLESLDPLI